MKFRKADDPQRFRRTLVPLDIEDADQPPSLLRRIRGVFRKKDAGKDESEAAADRKGKPV